MARVIAEATAEAKAGTKVGTKAETKAGSRKPIGCRSFSLSLALFSIALFSTFAIQSIAGQNRRERVEKRPQVSTPKATAKTEKASPKASEAADREMSRGRLWFERAYKQEKNSPLQASELYRYALTFSLPPTIKKSALWRLFYLQQQMKQYIAAFATHGKLRGDRRPNRQMQRILSKLMERAASDWHISAEAAKRYFNGLEAVLQKESSHRRHFESALYLHPNNRKLQKAISEAEIEYGKGEDALYFANLYSKSSPRGELELIEILVRLKLFSRAEELLKERRRYSYAIETDFTEKRRIEYLQGRIYQERGQWERAANHFKLAADQARNDEQAYLLALAAYNLYQTGEKEEALALMQEHKYFPENDAGLLRLILEVDVKGDIGAYQQLREMRYYLEARHKRKSSPLIRRAFLLASL